MLLTHREGSFMVNTFIMILNTTPESLVKSCYIILFYFLWKLRDPVLPSFLETALFKNESGNYSTLPFPWPVPCWRQGLIMWPRLASHLQSSSPSLLSARTLVLSCRIQPCLLVKERKPSWISKCVSKNTKLCLISFEWVSYHESSTIYTNGKTHLNIGFILNKLLRLCIQIRPFN